MSKMFEKFKSEKNWQIIGKLIELITNEKVTFLS